MADMQNVIEIKLISALANNDASNDLFISK